MKKFYFKNGRRIDVRPEVEVPIKTSLLALFALVSASMAVVFMLGTDFVYGHIYPVLVKKGTWALIVGSFGAIVISSLLVGLLFKVFLHPSVGSGIPQLKVAYRNGKACVPFRIVWVNMLAGIISLGGGISLGREGPTVFAGGSIAAVCADAFHLPPHRRKIACVAGAAAGLAAAFNTPIAAVMFVCEELADRINGRQLGGILMASVIGASASWLAIGRHPAYSVPELSVLSTPDYILTPFTALFAAMAGMLFQRQTLALRSFVKKRNVIPWLKPLFGGLFVWVLGITVYLLSGRLGVFSMGFDDLTDGLAGNLAWYVALLLLVAKLAATSLAYAWGCSGGIFAPSLFFGTMVGLTVAGVAQMCGVQIGEHGPLLLALVGMSACFGTVVRAPLTALLIVFEMTNRYEIVPPLMIGTMVSQAYAYYFSDKTNFYCAVLRQDGISLRDEGALY